MGWGMVAVHAATWETGAFAYGKGKQAVLEDAGDVVKGFGIDQAEADREVGVNRDRSHVALAQTGAQMVAISLGMAKKEALEAQRAKLASGKVAEGKHLFEKRQQEEEEGSPKEEDDPHKGRHNKWAGVSRRRWVCDPTAALTGQAARQAMRELQGCQASRPGVASTGPLAPWTAAVADRQRRAWQSWELSASLSALTKQSRSQ